MDAQFTVRGGQLSPSMVTTPAFLAVQVSVRNLDGATREVVVRADRDLPAHRRPRPPRRRA